MMWCNKANAIIHVFNRCLISSLCLFIKIKHWWMRNFNPL